MPSVGVSGPGPATCLCERVPSIRSAPHSRPGRGGAGAIERLLARYAKLSIRRPWTLLALAVALLACSAPLAVRLYTDLRTDLRELLPRGAPAAVALTSLEKRVGGTGDSSIVTETANPTAGERFVDVLSAALSQKLVPALATEVRARTDEDRAYLEAHGALYASVPDLTDLDQGIKEDVNRAKVKALNEDLDEEATAPDPRVERVIQKLEAKTSETGPFLPRLSGGFHGPHLHHHRHACRREHVARLEHAALPCRGGRGPPASPDELRPVDACGLQR